MLVNVRRLSEPKMVMGLTGPQAIKFTGDLCLEMLNTTGKSIKIVVRDVFHISPVDETGPDNNSSEIDVTESTGLDGTQTCGDLSLMPGTSPVGQASMQHVYACEYHSQSSTSRISQSDCHGPRQELRSGLTLFLK